jgi:hypothetical protein
MEKNIEMKSQSPENSKEQGNHNKVRGYTLRMFEGPVSEKRLIDTVDIFGPVKIVLAVCHVLLERFGPECWFNIYPTEGEVY